MWKLHKTEKYLLCDPAVIKMLFVRSVSHLAKVLFIYVFKNLYIALNINNLENVCSL